MLKSSVFTVPKPPFTMTVSLANNGGNVSITKVYINGTAYTVNLTTPFPWSELDAYIGESADTNDTVTSSAVSVQAVVPVTTTTTTTSLVVASTTVSSTTTSNTTTTTSTTSTTTTVTNTTTTTTTTTPEVSPNKLATYVVFAVVTTVVTILATIASASHAVNNAIRKYVKRA
jgi:hypothetical protein